MFCKLIAEILGERIGFIQFDEGDVYVLQNKIVLRSDDPIPVYIEPISDAPISSLVS